MPNAKVAKEVFQEKGAQNAHANENQGLFLAVLEQVVVHEVLIVACNEVEYGKKTTFKIGRNGCDNRYFLFENQLQKRNKQSQRNQVKNYKKQVVQHRENRVRFVVKGMKEKAFYGFHET